MLGRSWTWQNSQPKHFESCIHEKLKNRKSDIIFIEGESSRIGNISVPHFIMQSMKSGKHILAEGSLDVRVKRIIEEYKKVRIIKRI